MAGTSRRNRGCNAIRASPPNVSPATMPRSTGLKPCRTIIRVMSARVAPSATRTPISRVRRSTKCDRTPYRPASASAHAKAPSRVAIVDEI